MESISLYSNFRKREKERKHDQVVNRHNIVGEKVCILTIVGHEAVVRILFHSFGTWSPNNARHYVRFYFSLQQFMPFPPFTPFERAVSRLPSAPLDVKWRTSKISNFTQMNRYWKSMEHFSFFPKMSPSQVRKSFMTHVYNLKNSEFLCVARLGIPLKQKPLQRLTRNI